MQFGHFDDKAKEYVIDRPDTPKSWSNYLGTTRYGAVITNHAGGYGFFHSAAQGRFLRLRFNAIPWDQPGRYIYIHDRESKDYWSTSWQPCGKPLEQYKSVCRHGTAYTVITSEYTDIETETTYFVPLGKDLECWLVRLTNNDTKKRSLRLFTYVEYASLWSTEQDLVNIQYSQYTVKMNVDGNIMDHGTNVHVPARPEEPNWPDQSRHSFMAVVGADVTGFDTDREIFIGPYRTYANPIVVEQGKCTNFTQSGDNACGTFQIDVELEAGEIKECVVLLGIGQGPIEGRQAVKEFGHMDKVKDEFDKLRKHWHGRIDGLTAQTPDPQFDSMMNMWCPYNCILTYSWSRAASLVYMARRDGLGYRDTIQDFLGVWHNIADEAVKRLELMITGQCSTGGAMPIVQPWAHKPGTHTPPTEAQYRADDCLWLFNSIPAYVKETGDIAFYEKVLPYADEGEDTVVGHLRRAIEFNFARCGAHGLPSGLYADWNDCIRLGPKGETTFVAFQLRYALLRYIEICELLEKSDEAKWAKDRLGAFDKVLAEHTWDGEWFVRAYKEDGTSLGSRENEEASVFLNPQTWSVISGFASDEQAERAMRAVNEKLACEYGIQVCDPPFDKTSYVVVRAALMNKGMKENAGIFQHTQGWAVMAESILGHGDRAYEYFRAYMPAAYNDRAEVRQIEPYVYAQSTHSKHSPHYGASRIPWLSGTASWSYYAATQYILGIQPEYKGLRIDPCIPASWKQFAVRRRFRSKTLNIKVLNPSGVQKGVKSITLNGKQIDGNLIPVSKMKKQNEVLVEMG